MGSKSAPLVSKKLKSEAGAPQFRLRSKAAARQAKVSGGLRFSQVAL
jgi:hypothetical protein